MRITVDGGGRQPDQGQQLGDAGAQRVALEDVLHQQRLADDLPHGHARVQRSERVLEHRADVSPRRPQLAVVQRRKVESCRRARCRGSARRSAHRPAAGSGAWSCPSRSPTIPRFSPARSSSAVVDREHRTEALAQAGGAENAGRSASGCAAQPARRGFFGCRTALSRARVYSCLGFPKTSSTPPCSTATP